MKESTNVNEALDNYYYIIKITSTNKKLAGKRLIKVGEANSERRPDGLVAKYTSSNWKGVTTATRLAFEVLPHDATKRLNDKTIHKAMEKSGFFKRTINTDTLKDVLNETDGIHEIFEVVDNLILKTDNDIVKYINDLVKAQKKFTANRTANVQLNYTQKHLVNNELVEIIRDFGKLNLNREEDKNILLIGQFEPDWVATFALENNVFIWHDTKDECHTYAYNRLNTQIKYINSLKEVLAMSKKWDHIISNVPYGSSGANIVYTICTEIDFEENNFISLLPANDLKRNSTKDLYQYASDITPINNGFSDAEVTTHIARMHSHKVNSMTLDEFERSTYIDRQLDKYFEENSKRSHYAIDAAVINEAVSSVATLNNKTAFMIGERDVNHKALSASGITYEWNILKTIDSSRVLTSIGRSSGGKKIHFGFIKFNTELENSNFTNFMYNNSEFIPKLFTALNVDGSIAICKWAPKVDWAKPWTVEEILADYGYTQNEINEVIKDLDNFKGMKN